MRRLRAKGRVDLAERGEANTGRGLDVVDGHTAVRVACAPVCNLGDLDKKRNVTSGRHLRGVGRGQSHPDEGSVGVLEVHDGCPVVRFIFFESAGGAC